MPLRSFLILAALSLGLVAGFTGCSTGAGGGGPGIRQTLLPANHHGRLVRRTMRPKYLTIHSTSNVGGTADMHARLLRGKGLVSKNNPRFGRSGWVVWHYTIDDRETTQHLLPTEQGDHADYGGAGDRQSIGLEICEFGSRSRQAAAIDRAARLAASLANRYGIPQSRIVPHQHWPRWDYGAAGKPCPRIFLVRGRVEGREKWARFLAQVQRYR